MSRQSVQPERVEELNDIAIERLPVEREVKVVWDVRPEVLTGGHAIERVAQLVALYVDRDVAAAQELEPPAWSR